MTSPVHWWLLGGSQSDSEFSPTVSPPWATLLGLVSPGGAGLPGCKRFLGARLHEVAMGLQGAAVPAVLQSPRAAPALEKAHVHLEGRELFVPACAHSCLMGHCLLSEGWHLVPGPQLRPCGSPGNGSLSLAFVPVERQTGVPFQV